VHQYIEQMEEEVRDAVFGNVGTTVTFRVGPFDAETLETIFTPEFVQEDLVNLGFAQIYLSLMIDGIGSRPFSAVTIPPIEPPPRTFRKEVLEASRTSFAAKRPDIEEAILKELSLVTEEVPQKTSEQGNGQGQKKKNKNRPPEKKAPPQNPPSASTTAADLKAAIQAISKKVEETQTKTEVGRHEALKETLAHIAPKAAQSDVPPPPQGKKPAFEVPQENLEAVFKGDA
jgi:hypothetical protein